jgi:hypothetical protein
MAFHPELGRGCRRLARVVRLRRTLSNHDVGPQGDCFGHQVFQLARLVAA